jgi:hypothetical protein
MSSAARAFNLGSGSLVEGAESISAFTAAARQRPARH